MPSPSFASKAPRVGGKRKSDSRNTQSSTYPRLVVEIAAERGIDSALVLQGTRLTPELLNAPDTRVTNSDGARIVANAVRLTGNEGLGLELGLRLKPTSHGYLGYAIMSCGSLREGLELAIRFVHLRRRDVTLNLSVQGSQAVVEASSTHELGPLRHVVFEALMTSTANIGKFMLGEDLTDCELWFDWPEPTYFIAYRDRLPLTRFSMPAVQLRFPARFLESHPVMADPAAVKQALEQCEREQALGGRAPDDIIKRVRAELQLGADGYPDLAQVAAKLFMSDRTLKRKLHECGVSFLQLLEDARHREALRLLENPGLSIQEIATSLGYTDPPSFTRSFRRWTGQSPSEARAALQARRK